MISYTPQQLAEAVRFARDALNRRAPAHQANIHPDMLARLIWAAERTA